jgi:UDP-2,3-diacylglucosamine pyrophosphatase LpxH
MNHYRTAWISDVHLGTKGSNAAALIHFLRSNEFERLYIVGDLIDIWQLRRGIYWPQLHSDVIQKILRKGRKGTEIIYIPGNHDEFVSGFLGSYGSVSMQNQAIHVTADGRRLLILHGHELDTVVQNIKWLAFVGDAGYQFLLWANRPLNAVRRWLGLGFWSLSKYVKARVKNAVSFIGDFEKAIVRYSRDYEVDGVLCGHIHSPVIHEIDGVQYYNSGDWVESCSALVEHFDGRIELLTNLTCIPAETEAAEEPEMELLQPATLLRRKEELPAQVQSGFSAESGR